MLRFCKVAVKDINKESIKFAHVPLIASVSIQLPAQERQDAQQAQQSL